MPRFTVLLPTHNRADVIGFAILSILAQTEQDFELLVVGDGCTDGTADVVAAFEDRRIRWFDLEKAPHSGYANRNIALRQANGEFIAYAQHDDLMLPDHLALLGRAMGPEIEWAYSRPLWVTTDGIVVPCGTNLTIPDELRHFLEVRNTIPSNCVAHRRDCLERFGFWPEDIPRVADWLLWRTMVGSVGPDAIAYVPVGTSLHFSAAWKSSRHGGVPEVATWLAVIEKTGWWPQPLRRAVPPDQPEQRVWFEALRAAGCDVIKELRAATELVMDRQGWNSILHTLPRVEELETALAQHETALARHEADRAAANGRVAHLETSLRDAVAGHESAMKAAEAKARDLEAGWQAARVQVTAVRRELSESTARLTRTIDDLELTTRELERMTGDLDESRAAVSQLQQNLDAILASRSWRVTEPVRRLCGFMRGRFR